MPVKEEHLSILKKPFGDLIRKENITKENIIRIVDSYMDDNNQTSIVTVGDATTERILSYGIYPKIAIIDGVERRIRRPELKNSEIVKAYSNKNKIKFYRCTNRQGTISKEAYDIIEKIVEKNEDAMVFVDGEEDLLALPVFALARNQSLVLYGQPLEGIVVVKIDNKLKKKAQDLLDSIGFS
ncbi:MAG TPA: GTP-dependent dephospho-CoA kinase family protein [Nitrososphaeraceae archaeon]|nr:GTP-dependent dephospho-CoA kinase family protein [Nitrososphaeraceae archaeon]